MCFFSFLEKKKVCYFLVIWKFLVFQLKKAIEDLFDFQLYVNVSERQRMIDYIVGNDCNHKRRRYKQNFYCLFDTNNSKYLSRIFTLKDVANDEVALDRKKMIYSLLLRLCLTVSALDIYHFDISMQICSLNKICDLLTPIWSISHQSVPITLYTDLPTTGILDVFNFYTIEPSNSPTPIHIHTTSNTPTLKPALATLSLSKKPAQEPILAILELTLNPMRSQTKLTRSSSKFSIKYVATDSHSQFDDVIICIAAVVQFDVLYLCAQGLILHAMANSIGSNTRSLCCSHHSKQICRESKQNPGYCGLSNVGCKYCNVFVVFNTRFYNSSNTHSRDTIYLIKHLLYAYCVPFAFLVFIVKRKLQHMVVAVARWVLVYGKEDRTREKQTKTTKQRQICTKHINKLKLSNNGEQRVNIFTKLVDNVCLFFFFPRNNPSHVQQLTVSLLLNKKFHLADKLATTEGKLYFHSIVN
ncbi:hypothetical protein RFI_05531 [Reticulomyxa filosa]|uniref:Uncharacterized protein n=1 Tax=Reticulomyxa filosa TaxID=46433 RepID=X6P013_RETFI|nr:hypothetical protein RFI_05531 [Reticulomyxa filosa]|eukprot:ETO31591.1 hypothetical protein RFI_05531 [Reticulomyxa filosa]